MIDNLEDKIEKNGSKNNKKMNKHLDKFEKKLFKQIVTFEKKVTKMLYSLQGVLFKMGIEYYDAEIPLNVNLIYDWEYKGDQFSENSIQIAILDSGIDTDHLDLVDNIAWTYDATGSGSVEDETGHGTHAAGIIAASKNGYGVTGVYADAEIYAIKVVSGDQMIGDWKWLEEAIYKAVQGPDGIIGTQDDAEVISMSFGSRDEVPPQYIHDAISFAFDQGTVIVAAAGNEGDGDPSSDEINWPAAYDEVISVGTVHSDGSLAHFSNTGEFIEVVAPGSNILSTYLNNQYAFWTGTSMSVPHVSALIALIIAQYGTLPVGSISDLGSDTIRGILHSNTVDLGPSGWDTGYGWGLVQF